MARLSRLLASCALLLHAAGSAQAQQADAAPLLVPQSRMWSNLHQFLHLLGSAKAGAVPPGRPTVDSALADTAHYRSLDRAERHAWDAALQSYADTMARISPWSEPATVNALLAATPDSAALPPEVPVRLRTALAGVAGAYRRVWWPLHSRRNERWIAEQRELIRLHGDSVAMFLARSFRARWPRTIPLVVTAHASWAGAFETNDPLLVHVASTPPANAASGGLELTYHEAGHAIVDTVFGDLRAMATAQGKQAPRGFWQSLTHSLLFFSAGHAVQRQLPGYVTYAERWGVAARSPKEFALLRRYWLPYLEGQTSYEQAIGAMVANAPSSN